MKKRKKFFTIPTLSISKYIYWSKIRRERFFPNYFDSNVNENKLSLESIKKRRALTYLLKIKNLIPLVSKSVLRRITDKIKYFGTSILFSQNISLLMLSIYFEEHLSLILIKLKKIGLSGRRELKQYNN